MLEADGLTVRKTFTDGSLEERRQLALAELSRLERFHGALAAVERASCPEPHGLVEGDQAGLRMSFAAGDGLIDVLGRTELADEELERLGAVIAATLAAYVEAVGEPYHDLKLDNIRYAGGALTFLDLGEPPVPGPPDSAANVYELSVANLLASAVFESARPGRIRARRLHRQSETIAAAVVRGLHGIGVELRTAHVLRIARGLYSHHTTGRSSLLVRAWYATAGFALGRRIGLPDGAVFGPVAPWARGG